jgi:hypothetical protein
MPSDQIIGTFGCGLSAAMKRRGYGSIGFEAASASMSPYFAGGAFLIFSCLGFLTFLPPLSLRAIVLLLPLSSG